MQSRRSELACVCLAAGLLIADSFRPAHALGAQPELKKVHALLVIDTNSSLKDSVVVDKARMEALLVNGIPRDRCLSKTLTGKEVTRKHILDYFRGLKVYGSDSLFFFYAGHGAIDPKLGHFFYLQEGKTDPLIRADLRRVMSQKQAGLAVILSDCCSNHLKVPKKRSAPIALAPAHEIHPVLRCLLFQSRGIVNITAASDNSAWGDEQDGGIFTRTLARLMTGDLQQLDTDHDGSVSWQELFSRLDRETEKTFTLWTRQARARGDTVDQSSQRPHAFDLPGSNGQGRERSFAVVGLKNDAAIAVHYQYRWLGEEAWQSAELGPRNTIPHARLLSERAADLPVLELRLRNAQKTARLAARRWTGSGTPAYEDGTKYKVAGTSKKLRRLDVESPPSADDSKDDTDAAKPTPNHDGNQQDLSPSGNKTALDFTNPDKKAAP